MAAGPIQEVIQHIAAGAGDGNDDTSRREAQQFPVEAGVFPAGVVNQTVVMDERKKPFLQSGDHYQLRLT